VKSKTTEEAARVYATDNTVHLTYGATLSCSEIKEIMEVAYQAGREAEHESEKVIGERWVIVFPDSAGLECIAGNVLEVSEGFDWCVVMNFRKLPSNLTAQQRAWIDVRKREGYRAVKVKLVEVEV
jgi:hypothetical protein